MHAQTPTIGELHFDAWTALADSDPQAFEAKRAEIIQEFINSVPPERQQRLRQLQWRIDNVRRRATTPLGACIQISTMMWDSLVGPGGLYEALRQVQFFDTPPTPTRVRPGRVLQWRPRSVVTETP